MQALALPSRRAPATRDERDALILRYRPYVRRIARSLAVALPPSIEFDDLVGWGELGLVDAASRFDPARGVQFRTFAHHRIRGAILDGLRREPGADGCWTTEDFARHDADADGDETTYGRTAAGAACPERLAYLAEIRAALDRASSVLSPLERALLEHRYVDDQPIERLAKRLGFSKSWLSRVHTRALAKMRAGMKFEAGRCA